jgi:hypothetical protein
MQMDRGYEQLFLFVAILIAALIDLSVRWLRRKQGPPQGPEIEDEILIDERDEGEWLEVREIKPQPVPAPPPPTISTPTSGALQSLKPRAPKVRPRREPIRHWLTHPSQARRGIILMEILGPCRGLERPPERGQYAGGTRRSPAG